MNREQFEKWARSMKMLPQTMKDTDLGNILLADSEKALKNNGRIFYRTAAAIEVQGMEGAFYHDYELGETGASHSEKETRLKEAWEAAYARLQQLHAAGYFDDARRGQFSGQNQPQ